MVSYETTLPIGGTRALLPILESGGLRGGRDFDLVFSPERVKSQLVIQRLTKNPKIVGGLTPEAAARAAAFYGEHLGAPVINVGALETAEMVKLAGMVYRDVNIALANELARYCEAAGIDFPTVVQAANNDGEANLLQRRHRSRRALHAGLSALPLPGERAARRPRAARRTRPRSSTTSNPRKSSTGSSANGSRSAASAR